MHGHLNVTFYRLMLTYSYYKNRFWQKILYLLFLESISLFIFSFGAATQRGLWPPHSLGF